MPWHNVQACVHVKQPQDRRVGKHAVCFKRMPRIILHPQKLFLHSESVSIHFYSRIQSMADSDSKTDTKTDTKAEAKAKKAAYHKMWLQTDAGKAYLLHHAAYRKRWHQTASAKASNIARAKKYRESAHGKATIAARQADQLATRKLCACGIECDSSYPSVVARHLKSVRHVNYVKNLAMSANSNSSSS